MTPTLLLLLLLAQAEGQEVPPEATGATAGWHYLARGEATTLALLPRGGVGAKEGFLQVDPTFILDGGESRGLYPTPEGALRPGSFASLGLGVDDVR